MFYHIVNLTYNIVAYTFSILPYISIGFCLNRIYSMYNDYRVDKNAKKIVIKQVYISMFDILYKHMGENIEQLDNLLKDTSKNKLSLQDFDKLKKITSLTMDIAKEHDKKYKIIINNNKLTVTLLDKSYIKNNNLLELLSLLDLKIISNDNDDILTLEQN